MRKILIAEDHAIVIRGIKIIFETQFAGCTLQTVGSSTGLMKALQAAPYEVLLLDLQLEDGDVMHLVADIRKIYPKLKILIFSANPEEIYAQKLFREGVMGYLGKQSGDPEIIEALNSVLNGKIYMSDRFKRNLFIGPSGLPITGSPLAGLSSRELEVANLFQLGKRPSDICKELNLQSSTVSTYKMKIFTKLNVKNIIELKQVFLNYGTSK